MTPLPIPIYLLSGWEGFSVNLLPTTYPALSFWKYSRASAGCPFLKLPSKRSVALHAKLVSEFLVIATIRTVRKSCRPVLTKRKLSHNVSGKLSVTRVCHLPVCQPAHYLNILTFSKLHLLLLIPILLNPRAGI